MTRFVTPGPAKKDVIAQTWCIQQDPRDFEVDGRTKWFLEDFYPVRMLISVGDQKKVVALEPGLRFCPFFLGRNSEARAFGTLMKDLKPDQLTKLPERIDWVSNNGDTAARGDHAYCPDDLAEKTIIWIFPKEVRGKAVARRRSRREDHCQEGRDQPAETSGRAAAGFPARWAGSPRA